MKRIPFWMFYDQLLSKTFFLVKHISVIAAQPSYFFLSYIA